MTVLGFHLQFVPNEQDDQKDFLERIVTDGTRDPGDAAQTDVSPRCSSRPQGASCAWRTSRAPSVHAGALHDPERVRAHVPQVIDGIVLEGTGGAALAGRP